MKVAVYYNNKDVRIEEMEIPSISDDEILVKVISSGVCGSDVMEWYRIKKAPLVLGHEISGTVERAGKNVKAFKKGDRVFVSHHVPCMNCHYCRNGYHTSCETLHKTNFYPGGFSQFIKVPKINVELGTFKLNNKISFDEGTFIEPIGCVIRGQRIAEIKREHAVLVIGSGIAGLMHIAVLKSKGTRKIIAVDITDFRMGCAKKFGAHHTFRADENIVERIMEINNGRLADAVIVCTGALSAAKQACKCADKGGTILFFAVPKPDEAFEIPINDFWRNEVKVKTSYAAAPDDLRESINLIETGKLDLNGMITHKIKFSEIQKAFQLVADAKDSIKVIVEPNNF